MTPSMERGNLSICDYMPRCKFEIYASFGIGDAEGEFENLRYLACCLRDVGCVELK